VLGDTSIERVRPSDDPGVPNGQADVQIPAAKGKKLILRSVNSADCMPHSWHILALARFRCHHWLDMAGCVAVYKHDRDDWTEECWERVNTNEVWV